MEEVGLAFFPFPHLANGARAPGYRFSWPRECDRCDRQCERAPLGDIGLCSYGINFFRKSPSFLVFGFLSQSSVSSPAHTKAMKRHRENVVSRAEVIRAIRAYDGLGGRFDAEILAKKREILADYEQNKRYEKDFLDSLRPEMQKSLSFLHDYKQFIARVRQNINVVLESRYPEGDLEQKLVRALPAERAIYWASILMEEKLTTAFLLMNPDRIAGSTDVLFRLHGLVTKYLRIYASAFLEKHVAVRVVGSSVGQIAGNPTAVAVIPHTLIDNALKYSPRGSEVVVEFLEGERDIEFRVSSLGPKISDDEFDRIFYIFYRAREAVRQEEEGAGFGLYLAQFVANLMGTKIFVEQQKKSTMADCYQTTFAVKFKRER